MPVPWSMSDEPTRTPGRPGSPVIEMSPPAACMSASYPGSRASGPVWPYAPSEQYTSRGLAARTVVGPEPELLGEAGAEALEEDVGARGQPEQRVAAARVTERQAEGALPRVGREEHRALAVPERRAPGAAVVARVGSLHLDDVRAERGEDLGAVRACDRRRHVEHARPLERLVHGVHHRVCDDAAACSTSSSTGSPARSWSYVAIFAVSAIDAFFPIVPSETAVITGGVVASTGELSLLLVILCASAGAFVGDNISYGLGSWLGERTVKNVFRGDKSRKAFVWAEEQLEARGFYLIIIARFIPGGRTAVTFSSGYTHGMTYRRFVVADAVAALIWGSYAALLGYIGGKQFEEEPWKGLLLAFVVAISIAGLVELVRHLRERPEARGRRRDGARGRRFVAG